MSVTVASAYPLCSMTISAAWSRMRSSSSASKPLGRPARVAGAGSERFMRDSDYPGPREGKGLADLVEPDLDLVADLDGLGVCVRDVEQQPGTRPLGPVQFDYS